ncbi:MAG: FtsW/RodA/SpoVE family cell cycle protein, partial [Actinomycetes bacterium]
MSAVRTPLASQRRNAELGLGVVAILVTVGGYLLLALSSAPALPSDFWFFLAFISGLFFVAHIGVRFLAPNAEPTLLPLVTMLNGLGFVMISRLDLVLPESQRTARTQAVWIAVGIGVCCLVLGLVRNIDALRRYRSIFLALGAGALLLPLIPGLGYEANNARLWIHVGPLNFQPGEAAKVLLVIFFAAYLGDNRELLRAGTRRIGRMFLPAPRHLGPLLLPWGAAILIMVQQKDLGSS